MTVEEIFSKIAIHMEEGIKMHNEMAKAYNFLNLKEYAKCHYYHYLEEINNYNCLQNYYTTRFHKMIKVENINFSSLIPDSWYKYKQEEVDINTKRNSVKDFMEKWVLWEQTTKKLFQDSYKQLEELGEIAAAIKISSFICDVDKELQKAECILFELRDFNYDISFIIKKQKNYIINTKKVENNYDN